VRRREIRDRLRAKIRRVQDGFQLKRGRIQDRRKSDDGHQEDTKRRCSLDMLVKGSEAIVFVKFMTGKAWVSGTVIASEESGEVVVISHKWYLGNCP
jgi:hypothetical protein